MEEKKICGGMDKAGRKTLPCRLWIKTLAFLLTLVFGMAAVSTVIGHREMVRAGVYNTSEASQKKERFERWSRQYADDIVVCMETGGVQAVDTYIENHNVGMLSYEKNGNLLISRSSRFSSQQMTIDLIRTVGNWKPTPSPVKNGDVTFWQGERIRLSIPLEPEVTDDLYWENTRFHLLYSMQKGILWIGILAFLGMAAGTVFLISSAGHRTGSEKIQSGWGRRVPGDVLTVLTAAGVTFLWCLLDRAMGLQFPNNLTSALWVEAAMGTILLGWLMAMAVRIKQGIIWKESLICRGGKILLREAQTMPMLGKSLVIYGVIVVADGLLFVLCWLLGRRYDWMMPVFWGLEKLVLTGAVIYGLLMLWRLQKAAKAIAGGEIHPQVDTSCMLPEMKKHADYLGRIGEGMSAAVEQTLKSERMKTELITNVSHDIKTPLTSVINYADLIGKEPSENPQITEYAQVLLRQSERLKRLINDLVEASKASTGNLDIQLAPCEVGVMIDQAAGEYAERLEKSRLKLVVTQPEEPVRILADGRRMWRVLDNLMSNICKYAMPDTRVYLSLQVQSHKAVICLKNISREPLNMTAEELMERFVRGDSSRNSEGNGLGLAIAKSLTQLQKGNLNLYVDGDLFKVVLEFDTLA